MNCWDIAVKFYAEMLDIDLRNMYSSPELPPSDEIKNIIYSNMGEFTEVADPEFGDILIIKLFGIESHIGIYIGAGKFIHTSKGSGSVIERVGKYRKLIVGFYRINQR